MISKKAVSITGLIIGLVIVAFVIFGVTMFLVKSDKSVNTGITDKINEIMYRLGLKTKPVVPWEYKWSNEQVKYFLEAMKQENINKGSLLRFQLCNNLNECEVELKFWNNKWKFRKVAVASDCLTAPALSAEAIELAKADKCKWFDADASQAGGRYTRDSLNNKQIVETLGNKDFDSGIREIANYMNRVKELSDLVILRNDEIVVPPVTKYDSKFVDSLKLKPEEKGNFDNWEDPVMLDYKKINLKQNAGLYREIKPENILNIAKNAKSIFTIAMKARIGNDKWTLGWQNTQTQPWMTELGDKRAVFFTERDPALKSILLIVLPSDLGCNFDDKDPVVIDAGNFKYGQYSKFFYLFAGNGDKAGEYLENVLKNGLYENCKPAFDIIPNYVFTVGVKDIEESGVNLFSVGDQMKFNKIKIYNIPSLYIINKVAVFIFGNTGDTGKEMEGGNIFVSGNAENVGEEMQGGNIFVSGNAAILGKSMYYGRIFVSGDAKLSPYWKCYNDRSVDFCTISIKGENCAENFKLTGKCQNA